MGETIPLASLIGFMLALVRTTAWMAVSPPFNTKMLPRLVKLACAAGISMAMAPHFPADKLSMDAAVLLPLVLEQIATGLILGFLTLILFNSIQAAGALIDIFGGFTLSQSMDPFLNNQSSMFGRFYQLMATTLLFAINGHLLLLKGFMTSFDVVPLGGIHFENFKKILLHDISMFFLAAVEIAGPLLAAYFLADIAMGALTKAAPQMNILAFSFPFKILLTLLVVASAVPLIPGALHMLINQILLDGVHALKAGGR